MLTYTCKSCFNAFSEADKAWDKAVEFGVCPKCGKKLEDFHVSEGEAKLVRASLNEPALKNTEKSFVQSVPPKGWLFILSFLALLFVIITDNSSSFLDRPESGKHVMYGFICLETYKS